MNRLIFIRNGAWVTISNTRQAVFGSIRTKLFISLAAMGIVPLLLLTVLIFNSLRQDFRTQMTSEMLRQANTISTNVGVTGYLDNGIDENFLEDIQTIVEYRFLIMNRIGEVVYDANEVDEDKLYSSTEVVQILRGTKEQIVIESETHLTVYVPVYSTSDGSIDGLVMMIGSMDEIEAMIGRIRSIVSMMLIGIILTVLLLNVYFSGILTRPFTLFLQHVRRVSEGYIDERIEIKGNYEIAEIGHAFNEMLNTIEEIDNSRQQFVANVSHELKTPLSSMKVLAEALLINENAPLEFYKEFMEDISSEVDRETQIINDLLTLVSLDKTENKLNLAPVDVNKLVEQVMRMLKPVSEKQNITLEIKSYRQIHAMLDETKVYLVLMNLIENGIKYNEPEGKVSVSLNSDHRDMIIKVSDTGIGIPQESVSRIFDRFYRVDKMRSRDTGGTGLGLNIVYKTVLMHGGTIKCSSVEGEGTTFTVRLPLNMVVEE